MVREPSVAALFSDVESAMLAAFRGWEKDLSRPEEEEELRVRRVSDFLSSILPERFGVGCGHIVDGQGGMSPQVDVVLYDALEGIVLPLDEHHSIFPCECVYAAIEVRSRLTAKNIHGGIGGGTLFECMETTTQLRSLSRKNKHHDLPPITSAVFAYRTRWRRDPRTSVITWFEKFREEHNEEIPDAVFVLEPGFVIYTSDPMGRHDILSVLWNPLLHFTSWLITHLSPDKVETPDLWTEYGYFRTGKPYAEIHGV